MHLHNSETGFNIIDLLGCGNKTEYDLAKDVTWYLKNKSYVIVKNIDYPLWNADLTRKRFIAFTDMIGEHISHDEKNTIIWDIKAVENSSSVIQTFSEHSYEAELHTDSQYRENPEDYMALLSLAPATCGGGESLLMTLSDIYDELNARNDGEEIIKILENECYPFVVPTIFNRNPGSEKEYVFAPILANGEIRFRIDTLEKALPEHQDKLCPKALDAFFILKNIVSHSPKIKRYSLQAGDVMFVNNKTALHGRTAFSDSNRHLLRIRMNKRT